MSAEIVQAAMDYLAWRGHEYEPDDRDLAAALGELARVTGARNGSDLADFYERGLQDAYEQQLPRWECQCGIVYAVLPMDWPRKGEPREQLYTLTDDGCLDVQRDECLCGRSLARAVEDDTGQLDLFGVTP